MPTRILVVDDSPTIRKVVSALLERHGYEAVAAADGQIALEVLAQSDARFDLILLDFVMPRMNGFQFCRALRQRKEHRSLPVVLMSAKSDKIREQFVQQTGAIDAITKPFDAQALIAVIENAIRRSETWRARGEALAAGIPEEFELDESPRVPTGESDSRRARVAYEVVRSIARTLTPLLSKLPPSALVNEAQLTSELATHVSPDALAEVGESLRAMDFGPGGKLALAGDLSIIPIGAVLQLLQIENQTGTLMITAGKSAVSISMRSGLIDLVQAWGAGSEFRLGRYFVEHGFVTPGDIDALLRARESIPPPPMSRSGEVATGSPGSLDSRKTLPGTGDAPSSATDRSTPPPRPSEVTLASASISPRREESNPRRLIGDLLVDSGRVTKEQLRDALARQSSELTYEVLRWQTGRFEFRRETPLALAESARLGLPVASVVMEGFRRVDEWRMVEVGLGSFEGVLQRDEVAIDTLGEERLARAERAVLDAVDGERTVREIIARCHMSSFDACKILYQLLEARLVRRRSA